MKFPKSSAWITAVLCAATIATNAAATIQPKRVGPVSQYGALQAAKNSAGEGRIYGSVDGVADGKEVQLRGMSLSWSQNWPWGVSFYGNTYIDTLVGGWNVELVRSAMGTVAPWGQGVYMTRPEYYEAKMDTVVQAAIENDIYVLIDWHSEGGYYNCIHKGVKPRFEFNDNKLCFTAKDAADFFERMAIRYGKYPHVIFEIYNEPVSESWDDLKAYADTVTAAIRKHSDNLIVVGTPAWSSMAGDAVNNPVNDKNVAYTYHFYANMHKTSEHTASSNKAMAAGLSVFVTEWGGIHDIFSNADNKTQLEAFLQWTNEKKLSTAMWNVERPFLGSDAVADYTRANILPQKTTYAKRLDWETKITDNLPNLVTYGDLSEIKGSWKIFADMVEADGDGNYGTSSVKDNSADGVGKMDEIVLDPSSPFSYSPYAKADYVLDGAADLSKCKMLQYTYKGSNHELTLYYDWNESTERFGSGAWDFPYIAMPLTMDWETVNIDMGWMTNNGWQSDIPGTPVLDLVRAIRFNVIDTAFSPSLWIKDVKCVGSVEGYTPVKIPDGTDAIGTRPVKTAKASYSVMVQGQNISVTGIPQHSRYALLNMLGQAIATGSANGQLNLTVPQAGRYVLRLGSSSKVISIK